MSMTSTLQTLLQRRRYESELDEELQFHVDARAAELQQTGVAAAEARRLARVELGGWESHKDGMRQVHRLRWLDEFVADVRYAARTLRRSRMFTLVAVGSLALAIGANTNIFSLANQLLYMRLNVPRPKELRVLSVIGPSPSVVQASWGNSTNEHGQYWADSLPYPVFKQLQAKSQGVAGIAGFKDVGQVSATVAGVARPQTAQVVSGNLYQLLEVAPQLGRGILPSDEGPAGTGFVAVISDRFWHTAFGGKSDVIGTSIRVNGNVVTIVGVNAPGFTGAASTTVSPDLFLPISLVTRLRAQFRQKKASILESPDFWWVNTIARAKPGVSDAKAIAELSVLLDSAVRSTQTIKPDKQVPHIQMDDGSRGLRFFDFERKPLEILLVLTGLVLLLACANIANLMLARTAARMREMSIRLALGASRGRILRQVITESLLISLLGGVAGLLLAFVGRDLLVKLYLGRQYLTRPIDVHFDWRVLSVTAAVSITTGLLFGILPAWRATHANVSSGLKDSSQASTRRRGAWTGKLIISFQLALSTMLVAGAALFVRTLWNLNHVDPGFKTANLLEFDIDAPTLRYPGPVAVDLLQRIQQRVGGLPGIGQLAMAGPALLGESQWFGDFQVEGVPKPSKESDFMGSAFSRVSPGFFKTMGIPILRGRDLTDADTATSLHVSVINESAAKKFFGGMDPLGRRFNMGDDPDTKALLWYTVVGICADTQYSGLRDPRQPLHFEPIVQSENVTYATFVVRTSLRAPEAVPMIRRAITGIDSDLPMMNVRMLDDQIADSLKQERLIATLTAGFGLLALLLASIGIYGLMAYTVAQRTNEIGIRLALGAGRGQVRTIVLREVIVLTLAGVFVGIAGVLTAMHLMRSVLYDTEDNFNQGMLFGQHGYDPASLAVTVGILIVVALLAGWIPAARASRVEPMEALRHE